MRGVTESPLFSGYWMHLFYQISPFRFIPANIYNIFYNTNEWKFDSNNPATFKGTWHASQYTILDYNPSDFIAVYMCQPILFGMMKFEEVIVMTAKYSDYPESMINGP